MPVPPVTTDVALAAARLLSGGLVVIPTETVYGLGADADDPTAVGRVFAVKARPPGHPLIVHVGAAEQLAEWAAHVPPSAATLAAACWPGPLTVLVERAARVLDDVTGGRSTVGVRVPAHALTLELLQRTGRGVAAPSANRFGRVSPTTAAHVLADLGPALDPARDVVLDGGPCPVGVESTIVDCTADPPQVLRPGGIPTEDVERLLEGVVAPATGPSRAAGMLPSHYAPEVTVLLAEDRATAEEKARQLAGDGLRVDVVDFGGDLVESARTLYAVLRDADRRRLDRLVAVLPPRRGLGHAIRDRLAKAAARR
jgi:L-threonylcarbamoyladenylate synthase